MADIGCKIKPNILRTVREPKPNCSLPVFSSTVDFALRKMTMIKRSSDEKVSFLLYMRVTRVKNTLSLTRVDSYIQIAEYFPNLMEKIVMSQPIY